MPVHPRGLCAILLGLGVGWGAGNVGPVATSLAHSFHVSLAAVGVLSGTAYFAAIAVATPLVVPLAARFGVVRATVVAAAVMSAVAPGVRGESCVRRPASGPGRSRRWFRACAGSGAGHGTPARRSAATRPGAWVDHAGHCGGAWSGQRSCGCWHKLAHGLRHLCGRLRVAALCASAATCDATGTPASAGVFLAAALRTRTMWRLGALFVAANGVPLIVSAWLVAYLTSEAHVRTAVAGVLAFVLFGLTAVIRPLALRLVRGSRRFATLAAGGLGIGAAGLVALAASRSVLVAGLWLRLSVPGSRCRTR